MTDRTRAESTDAGSAPAGLKRRTVLKAGIAQAAAAAATLPLVNIAHAQSRTLRIGMVSSLSGPAAAFGEASEFMHEQMKGQLAKGLDIGGKHYTVELLMKDSQSTTGRAAAMVTELMTRDKVDICLSVDGNAAVGASQMASVSQVPLVSTMIPWDALVGARGGAEAYSNKGKPWHFHFLFSAADIGGVYLGLWDQILDRTNRKVGTLYLDTPAARGFADPQGGFPSAFKSRNLTDVPGGFFKLETDDFSNQVSLFKREQADLMTGFLYAPHFAALWRQCAQAGYQPKVVTMAAAFLFPSGIDALGDRGDGLSTEIWWSPKLNQKSSLTGQTCRELADAYERATGRQWTPVLGYAHAPYEIAVAALKAAGDPKDKAAVRQALDNLKLDTVAGTIDWKDAKIRGIAPTPLAGGQWRKAKSGKYKYDILVAYNKGAEAYPLESPMKLLTAL